MSQLQQVNGTIYSQTVCFVWTPSAYTLLKKRGHMRPRPHVVRAIGSQCVLNASWVHSHLYLALTTCDRITQDTR